MIENTAAASECKPCKIKEFLQRPHTSLEKALMISAGVLAGVAIGFALSPIKGGIEVSIGSHNGCGNHHNDGRKISEKK